MPGLLTDLLSANTIQGLDGNDERFAKMERAAGNVAAKLRDRPPLLIRAVLAGLDPDIPPEDPAIVLAEEALLAEWKSMASVFPDKPIGWLRFILLGACEQVAKGRNAAIVWLTAADTLPWTRLGREEGAVRRALTAFAEEAERVALDQERVPTPQQPKDVSVAALTAPTAVAPKKVGREALLGRVAAAAGPNNRQGQGLPNPNPHWSNSAQHWSFDFTDRMRDLLADEFDALATDVAQKQSAASEQLHASQKALAETFQSALTNQRRWVHEALKSSSARQRVEQLRLDALWWAEAMYSTPLRRSYRELPPALAAAVMAIDLIDVVTTPTPASVGYLLAETVARLPDAGHSGRCNVVDILDSLRETRSEVPADWRGAPSAPPSEGRLSIRDLVVLALGDREWSSTTALARAGLPADAEIALPDLARAVFRQEQAVRLAEPSK